MPNGRASPIAPLIQIFSNAFGIAGVQAINFAVPLIALPFISRALGLESFGQYAVLLAYGNYVILFGDFSFNVNGPLRVHDALPQGRLAALVRESTLLKVILLVPAALAFVAATIALGTIPLNVALSALVLPVATVLTPRWIAYSLGKLKSFAAVLAICRVGWLAIVVFCVRTSDDLILLLLLSGLAQIVICALTYSLVKEPEAGRKSSASAGASQIFLEDWKQFIALLASSSLRELGIIFLSTYRMHSSVAIYAVADRVRVLMLGLVAPLTQSIFLFTARSAAGGPERDYILRRNASIIVILIASLGSGATFFLADRIIRILAGVQFAGSAEILRILCAIPVLNAVNSILGTNMLLAEGEQKSYASCQLLTALISAPCIAALIYIYGAVGAAAGAVLSELILAALFLFMLRRHGLISKIWP
jgi:polysaccharide transporter, PST family